MFKVIVAGSRTMRDYNLLRRKLDQLLSRQTDVEIVSGTANGADKLGERYAKDREYALKQFPADWEKYGKRAGYLRNAQMADYADALVAFWDAESKGTMHMIELAKAKGLKIVVVKF